MALLLSAGTLRAGTDTTTCNWMSRIFYFNTWDTCQGYGKTNNINAAIILKGNTGCYKYAWSVNGTIVSTTNLASYKITGNGTFKFCLKVTDTCNLCDTSVCIGKTITCFKPCVWKTLLPRVTLSDSCGGKTSPPGIKGKLAIINPNCLKVTWSINGVQKGAGVNFYSAVGQNQSYTVCVKLTDTCRKCDTTICLSKTVNCPAFCNYWTGRFQDIILYDSCSATTHTPVAIKGHVLMQGFPCLKQTWTINGVKTVPAGMEIARITQNGTYNICLKIEDTCKKCDTTICRTMTVLCKNKCNWKARLPKLSSWDTCLGVGSRNSINGSISFQNSSTSCFRYSWQVNMTIGGVGKVFFASDSSSMSFKVTQNGSYGVYLIIYDTCNNCDTAIYFTRNISCFPFCKFKANLQNFYTWDTCQGTGRRNSLNSYIVFKNDSCFKYEWKVNNVNAGNTNILNYPFTQNGSYKICVKVTDTCNQCDTTYCTSRVVNCIGAGCVWADKAPALAVWDSCRSSGSKINAYLSLNNRTCVKYKWKLNGVSHIGSGFNFSYPVTKNGTYTVCVTVSDSCDKCNDTTFCITKTISCVPNPCDFKSRGPIFSVWDTCYSSQANILGYMFFNNSKCLQYQWKVAGTVMSNLQSMNYAVTKNGTYAVCVKVTDTCNQCDTTICMNKVINCRTLAVNAPGLAVPSIYPNPAGDFVSIDWPAEASHFEIVNIFGSPVMHGDLSEGSNTVSTAILSSGIYMLKIHSAGGIVTARLLIQR
jgi:hypothetical protein